MDPKKSNKIFEIVRLQQILKKWRKLASTSKSSGSSSSIKNSTSKSSGSSCSIKNSNNGNSSKGKLLRRTLSLSEKSDAVPKGYLAVCVGKELKRFVIPTKYLSHQAFIVLLRIAEEEFGFQQAGVLQIPCEVSAFENILRVVEKKEFRLLGEDAIGCCSSESPLNQSYHPRSPMCT